jgi:two-component system OmpR family sensor kinase
VPPERLAGLVQPFRRERGAGDGSGLGLAIADAVARQSGGTLQLESPLGGGRGFRAVLRLPVAMSPISRPPG